jgi:hypothetical protein
MIPKKFKKTYPQLLQKVITNQHRYLHLWMVCKSNISMHVEDKLPIVLGIVSSRNLGKPKILEHKEKRPNSNLKHSFIIWVICYKRRAYVWDYSDFKSLSKAPSIFFKSKIWWWLFVVMFPPLDMFFIYHPTTCIVSLKVRSTMHCNFYWKWIAQCLFFKKKRIPWCKWLQFGSYPSLFIFVVSCIIFLIQNFFFLSLLCFSFWLWALLLLLHHVSKGFWCCFFVSFYGVKSFRFFHFNLVTCAFLLLLFP